jgi:hypothetical protein
MEKEIDIQVENMDTLFDIIQASSSQEFASYPCGITHTLRRSLQ